jgi:ATP phosphoribosyltransferase regulatory subunit
MVKTPQGVRDILPQETKERIKVINNICKIFEDSGYEQIITPTFENYEYIRKAFASSLDSETMKFFDPSGELMVLRPDFTTSVVRVVATRMKEIKGPIRLFYSGDVYRVKKFASETQFHQLGVELIDCPRDKGDQEILALAEKVMKLLKIKGYKIVTTDLAKMRKLSASELEALTDQDFVSLGRLPEPAEIMPTDISYYTGLYFEIYVPGCGYAIASGGRYDNLMGKFGDPRNAVGFAINLSRLMEVLKEG